MSSRGRRFETRREHGSRPDEMLFAALAIVVLATIFVLDLGTDLGFAAGTMYILAVVTAYRTRQVSFIWGVAATCCALTVVGLASARGAGEPAAVLANRGMSIGLIGLTALACHRGLTGSTLLARHAAQQQTMLDAAPVGMLSVDGRGTIRSVNTALLDIFGYGAHELVGEPVEVLIPAPFRSQHAAQREDFLRSPTTRKMGAGTLLAGIRKDGSEVPVEIGLRPIDTNDGRVVIASVVDTTHRVAAHAAREQLAAIVEASDDAIISEALDGTITSWNPAAVRLYGYRAEEMIGASIERIVPPDRRTEFHEILAEVGNGNSVERLETTRRTKHGTIREVSVTVSPIHDAMGGIVGAAATARDITDRRAQERQLVRYTAALERANRDLDDFVYAAAHDLRSPLDGLRNLIRWVKEDNHETLAPGSVVHLDQMRTRVTRLERLLDDLLAYARAGQDMDELTNVAVGELVTEIGAQLQPSPAFEITTAGELPAVRTSKICLAQTLRCLIANGVNHHDRQDGCISVSHHDKGAFDAFTVRDDGPGIPAQYRTQVFGLFETLRPRDEVEGSGLGLSIAHKIVERAGGEMRIDGNALGGTDVTFTMPKRAEFAATGT